MSKRFRLRISKIIFSINPCSSKDPSNPVPSIFRFSTVNPTVLLPEHRSHPATTTGDKPHRSFLKRHVSAAFMSVGCCRSRSKPTLSDHDDDNVGSTRSSRDETFFQWEKQDNWHVIAKVYDDEDVDVVVETPRRKIYTSSVSGRSETENDDVLPPPPPPPSSAESKKKKKRRPKKKTTSSAARSILLRISTSSAESGLFSNEEDEDEETETLVSSSRSLSTSDSSSEFNTQLETIREVALDHNNYPSNNNYKRSSRKKKKKKSSKRCVSKQGRKSSSSASSAAESAAETTPARLSMFQRMIPCTVDGKVRESFAVVKKSADPYEDFKRSMMEMILEKQMFEDKDLEQLLHCFLSLNSRDHHGIIVRAFSEIWEILFSSRRVSRAL
ncbi:transcription repressor OFP7 [Humulus lupulus]|uniref:transcription repressor OFP7 n=1 Tax=Humulus lupulus TaxID=3486 RepID=UPI002B40DFA7|nr:transcription repressor OFP7 [Humulus lupulus]